jgi:hypothetical protein
MQTEQLPALAALSTIPDSLYFDAPSHKAEQEKEEDGGG